MRLLAGQYGGTRLVTDHILLKNGNIEFPCGTVLYKHGIFQEKARYRAHVCVTHDPKIVIVAPIASIKYMIKNKRKVFSYGLGRSNPPTAYGYLLPIDEVTSVISEELTEVDMRNDPGIRGSTIMKGNWAESIVASLYQTGRLGLFCQVDRYTDKERQLQGRDMSVSLHGGVHELEVKYDGGSHSGNLFIQTHERSCR